MKPVNHEKEAFKWWERHRVVFNLLIGIAGFIGLFIAGIPIDMFTVVGAFMWALFVNLCYCLGFYLEMVNVNYFKGRFYIKSTKYFLLVIGTLLAILVSLVFPSMIFFPAM